MPSLDTTIRSTRRNIIAFVVGANLAVLGLGGGAALALAGHHDPGASSKTPASAPAGAPTSTTSDGAGGTTTPAPPPARGDTSRPDDGGTSAGQEADLPTVDSVLALPLDAASDRSQGSADDGTRYTMYVFELENGMTAAVIDSGNDGTTDAALLDVDSDGTADFGSDGSSADWQPVDGAAS